LRDAVAKPRDDRQKDLLRPALEEIIDLGRQVRRVTRPIRRKMKRRAAVEPVIGHLKAERGGCSFARRVRRRPLRYWRLLSGYPEAKAAYPKSRPSGCWPRAMRMDSFSKSPHRYSAGPRRPWLKAPDANAEMHVSLTVPWWPAEFVPKKHYGAGTFARNRGLSEAVAPAVCGDICR
jgi:hypothetical protein